MWRSTLILFIACSSSPSGQGPDAARSDADDDAVADSNSPRFDAARDASSGGEVCFLPPVNQGRIASLALTEISGIAASRRNPRVLYVHNDSGEPYARFFAIRDDGADLGELRLMGADFDDWEDIAVAQGDNSSFVLLGDIGDNAAREGRPGRATIRILRIVEPLIDADAPAEDRSTFNWDRINLRYEDGPHDAEALLVDPRSDDIYLITKEEDGQSGVFVARAPEFVPATNSVDTIVLERVATIGFGTPIAPGDPYATAGDMSPDGTGILIRSYTMVHGWFGAADVSFSERFTTPSAELPVAFEIQGEAIGFAADGKGYFTVSEGEQPTLSFYPRCD
ncbi:MAG: hypothetical protein AAGF12_27360 [Myxococcota bacterium]